MYSETFYFTTRENDCSSVSCVQGNCNETTLSCMCDYGWTGPECSIAPEKDDGFQYWFSALMHLGNLTLILAVCVGGGGGLLLLVAFLAIILIARRRRNRHKIKLQMPDFTKFMYTPSNKILCIFCLPQRSYNSPNGRRKSCLCTQH